MILIYKMTHIIDRNVYNVESLHYKVKKKEIGTLKLCKRQPSLQNSTFRNFY